MSPDPKALYEAIRRDAAPTTLEIDGRTYASASLVPVRTPTPEPLTVKTLSAIEDYLRTNVDGLDGEKIICHVESPESVAILSALQGSFDDRKTYTRSGQTPAWRVDGRRGLHHCRAGLLHRK